MFADGLGRRRAPPEAAIPLRFDLRHFPVLRDGPFLRAAFTDRYAAETAGLRDGVIQRLVPTFDTLDDEADALADHEFERLGRLPGGDGTWWDMGDAAGWAQDAAISYHQRLTRVRQGLMNLATAGLYHLYEQQATELVLRGLLHPREERDPKTVEAILAPGGAAKAIKARLKSVGIDAQARPSFGTLDELRLVANVVKHGAGPSAKTLLDRRPHLFTHPDLRGGPSLRRLRSETRPRVYRPAVGEDLYVTVTEFQTYADRLVAFWSELGATLDTDGRPAPG